MSRSEWADFGVGNDYSHAMMAKALGQPNPSGVIPVEYNIIVRPDPVEEKTKGGLYIPDEHREREEWASTKATVMAMSPMAFRKTANGDAWEGPAPV